MCIKKYKYNFIVMLILFSVLLSCKKADDNPVIPNDRPNNTELIPIAIGNKWVYLDSITTTEYGFGGATTTSLSIKIDSVTIISEWIYKGNTLYNRDKSLSGFPGPRILARNDSIYSADVIGIWDPLISNYRDSLDLTLMYFIPPDDRIVEYKSHYFASTHKKTINTLVGIFNKYYVYANDSYFYDSTYIAPKVGITRRVTYTKNTRLYPTETKHVTNLIRYKFVE